MEVLKRFRYLNYVRRGVVIWRPPHSTRVLSARLTYSEVSVNVHWLIICRWKLSWRLYSALFLASNWFTNLKFSIESGKMSLQFLICCIYCTFHFVHIFIIYGFWCLPMMHIFKKINLIRYDTIWRDKGRDLTQSYDKSPYTSRDVKRAKWQHKQRYKKVRLQSGCGPT